MSEQGTAVPGPRPGAGMLVLMGSGETTPTMVTTHQQVMAATRARTGGSLDAVLLDTPYGFQENAAEISARAQQYFDHHVGQQVGLVAADLVAGADPAVVERALDAVRRADWVFAGPGSPTYALRQWTAAPFADAMAEVVERGGTLVLASAAAVTVGSHALPVYEVYKAGEAPGWRPGLDLLERLTGWACAVVPHFDNAEGGTHDTRFCYMGERRLRAIEADLPDDGWILGIDEHTACVIDVARGTLTVQGRGAVHVRRDGTIVAEVPAGGSAEVADLDDAGTGATSGSSPVGVAAATPDPGGVVDGDGGTGSAASEPVVEEASRLRAAFDEAVAAHDADAATAAVLATEQLVRDWSADTQTTDALPRAVAALRGMITRLGTLAGEGMHDHTELVRPLVETLLHVRDDARERKVYDVADHIRGHMDREGVRVRDTRDGTSWEWEEPRPDQSWAVRGEPGRSADAVDAETERQDQA